MYESGVTNEEAGFQFQYRGLENTLYLLSSCPVSVTQGSLFGYNVLTVARDTQNIGIGKASTTYKLDVSGSVACGNISSSGKIGTGSSSILPFYDLQVGYSNTLNTNDQSLAIITG